MTIDLQAPHGAVVREAQEQDRPTNVVGAEDARVPRNQFHCWIIEFPAYEAPDTGEPVTIEDLRAIARRDPRSEDTVDPGSGLPEGWS